MPEPHRPGRVRIRRKKRKRDRWKRYLIIIPAIVLIAGIALAVPPIGGAQARLGEARRAVEKGREAILQGDPSKALDEFIAAEAAFRQATVNLGHPMTAVVGWLPLLGRTIDSLRAMAEAGALAAKAGRIVAAPAAELAEDRPPDEIVPLRLLVDASPYLARANRILDRAAGILKRSPRSLLLAPVGSARAEFASELGRATRAVRFAQKIANILPEFLGERGPKRYFFGAQNPSEQRGTGGLVGAWTVMKARAGRIHFGRFVSIGALDNLPPERVNVHPSLKRRYDRFGGLGFWPNINMSPYFSEVATAIEQTYRQVTGETLDGVILADPFVLESLLEVSGPVPVPRYDVSVRSENVVRYVTNGAYAQIRGDAARKELLGRVATRTFRTVLGGNSIDRAGQALLEAAGAGHVFLHSTDRSVQAAFEEVGVAGAVPRPRGDYLAVIGNNASGTKVDFYAQRTVLHEVELEPHGLATARTEVTVRNLAPARGQPRYVIGPLFRDYRAGENATYLSVYCARGCRPVSAQLDGQQVGAPPEEELGHPVLPAFLRIPSRESVRVEYHWALPRVWRDAGDGGVYRLVFQGQPTIRNTRLVLDILPPAGTEITGTSPGMRIEDGRARWEGTPRFLQVFTVRFQ